MVISQLFSLGQGAAPEGAAATAQGAAPEGAAATALDPTCIDAQEFCGGAAGEAYASNFRVSSTVGQLPAAGPPYVGVLGALCIGSGPDAELAAALDGERLRDRDVGGTGVDQIPMCAMCTSVPICTFIASKCPWNLQFGQ